MPLKTFKLLIFHITPIISASVAEPCRGAAEYPLSRLQLLSRSRSFFFLLTPTPTPPHSPPPPLSTPHAHLAENTVQLTETCVKFNYGPAADALCVTQGDWEEAAARRRLCRRTSEQRSQWPGPLPGAGHVPSHGPNPPGHPSSLALPSLCLSRCSQVSRGGKRNPTHIVGHFCL